MHQYMNVDIVIDYVSVKIKDMQRPASVVSAGSRLSLYSTSSSVLSNRVSASIGRARSERR